MKSLKELEGKSIYIIREALSEFKNPAVLWSTGKDSTLTLHLIRKANLSGDIPLKVVHIDTGRKFREIYDFRDRIADEWKLDLMVIKSDKVNKIDPKDGIFNCCHELKTKTLQKAIKENGFDSLIVSIRRDEQGIRNKERYMSPRDKSFKWAVSRENKGGDSGLESLQDGEMFGWDLYPTDYPEASHIRVHPILHWTEKEVWEYTKLKNIPFNPLYTASYVEKEYGLKDKRFRSLGCSSCTKPIHSKASTISEIIKELDEPKEEERAGRNQDKEGIMERLRSLGYM